MGVVESIRHLSIIFVEPLTAVGGIIIIIYIHTPLPQHSMSELYAISDNCLILVRKLCRGLLPCLSVLLIGYYPKSCLRFKPISIIVGYDHRSRSNFFTGHNVDRVPGSDKIYKKYIMEETTMMLIFASFMTSLNSGDNFYITSEVMQHNTSKSWDIETGQAGGVR